jgi:hypothetical protein
VILIKRFFNFKFNISYLSFLLFLSICNTVITTPFTFQYVQGQTIGNPNVSVTVPTIIEETYINQIYRDNQAQLLFAIVISCEDIDHDCSNNIPNGKIDSLSLYSNHINFQNECILTHNSNGDIILPDNCSLGKTNDIRKQSFTTYDAIVATKEFDIGNNPLDTYLQSWETYVYYEDNKLKGHDLIYYVGPRTFNIGSGPAEFELIDRTESVSPNTDSDNDGLPDIVEQNGLDYNKDGNIDITLPNANPFHKDIYIEIDYMQCNSTTCPSTPNSTHRPYQQALDDVINAFANAPVSNPDGNNGITLHLLVDEPLAHIDQIDSRVDRTFFGTNFERNDPNNSNIIAAKKIVYHYAIFAHALFSGWSGVYQSGREFIVSLGGGWGTDDFSHGVGSIDQQEGTFMHELGHDLGLAHGGAPGDNINGKPNYMSVMNYDFQFKHKISDRPLDYSPCALPQTPPHELDEEQLIESNGIGTSCPSGLKTYVPCPSPPLITLTDVPIDWNRNNIIENAPINQDINCNLDRVGGQPTGDPIHKLKGHDDWKSIADILKTTVGPFSNSVPGLLNPPFIEFSIDDLIQSRFDHLESINSKIQQVPNTEIKLPPVLPFKLDPSKVAQALKDTLSKELDESSNLSKILQSTESTNLDENLDKAISILIELRNKMDSSLGGNPEDDIIKSPQYQQQTVLLIDNFIQSLELQK